MKLVNWNIEWMNHWFTGNADPAWGSSSLSAADARRVADRVAKTIDSLQADVLCVQEGPSALAEMQLFIADFMSDDNGTPQWEAVVGVDGSAQKIYALRRLDGAASHIELATDDLTVALMDAWDADVNGDMMVEAYDFTRVPLVVDLTLPAGRSVRVVVLHTKSKYVHNGRDRFEDPARRQGFIVDALLARRRISAEGFRLRTYLDGLLEANLEQPILVVGDFNDGPGRDFFERSFLTHNVTDIILGSTFYPSLILDHPILRTTPTPSLFTARFDDYVDGVDDRPLLLDHILVSPGLAGSVIDAGINHAEFDAQVQGSGEQRVDRPSDHRPVWVEI